MPVVARRRTPGAAGDNGAAKDCGKKEGKKDRFADAH
jgi:hypothetical protein